METFVLTYDICDPRRLRRVARCCEDFGLRRQYSVFLCRLPAVERVRLRGRLLDLIDPSADQVLFIPLCSACAGRIEALGRPFADHAATDVVMVV
jgi:CRISPR-associated protein Cas2